MESKVEKILSPDVLRLAYENFYFIFANRNFFQMAFEQDLDQKLRVFSLFIAFLLDIEDQRKMQNLVDRKAELTKSMVGFSEPKHMAMFGRSL
jgi:hypothetical protein